MFTRYSRAIGCFLMAGSGLDAFPTGSGLTVTVSSHPFSIDGGGRFTGTVDGVFSNFWCVDSQIFVSTPQTFTANVLALTLTPGGPDDMREEELRGGNHTLFRYQMVAYLTTLFDESLGAADARNRAIQSSIRKTLDIDSDDGAPVSTTFGLVDYYADAIAVVNAGSFDFSEFRLVSGTEWNDTDDDEEVRTFITEVPEPGFYLALAVGLAGLFTAHRFRFRKST